MMDRKRIEAAIREILVAIGEDPDREGLVETPQRVAGMLEEVFAGLSKDPREHAETVFNEKHEEMVLIKDIQFFSICEHHLVPFFGVAHIAYLPKDGRIIGLSKIAHILDDVSKRPQMQERITSTVADILVESLDPMGVIVVVEAVHMCMTVRGVKKQGSKTVTSAARGIFKSDSMSRNEVLSFIGK